MNDLSTIDRLVEFGMGTALASQMIKTMNQSINSMVAPGVSATAPAVGTQQMSAGQQTPAQYYAAVDGHQAGPLNESELKTLISKGLVSNDTLMWRPGLPGWRVAADIPEVNKILLLSI